MRPSLPAPQGPQRVCLPSRFHSRIRYNGERFQEVLSFQIWWILNRSFVDVGWQSTNEPNGTKGPFEWFSKSSFIRSFAITQSVLKISKVAVKFHGIRPPTLNNIADVPSFILRTALSQQTLQFLNDEGLMCTDSTLSLHRLCQIPGNGSVNDSWLPGRFQELLRAPFRFLWSFSFTRIRLNPLSS